MYNKTRSPFLNICIISYKKKTNIFRIHAPIELIKWNPSVSLFALSNKQLRNDHCSEVILTIFH